MQFNLSFVAVSSSMVPSSSSQPLVKPMDQAVQLLDGQCLFLYAHQLNLVFSTLHPDPL